jgi:superfamily II DNA or RNA helicase
MSDKPRESDDDPNIFIGCYQSLEKFPKEWFRQFHTVVVDEAHSAKSSTIKSILKRTFGYAKMRYGVSGTFPPEDSCEILLIQSLLGPEINKISASDLIKSGNITPVEIFCMILNHNEPELMKKLKSAKSIDNGNVIYNYEKKFFQESEKRVKFIEKLVKNKCKDNTMILFHTIEHGKKIYEKLKENQDIDVYFIDGEVNNKERNIIIEQMNKTDRIKILVSSYGTTGTGLSINSIFNIIFADSFKSESLVIQAIGRSLRKFIGKHKATIYDLVDIFDPTEIFNIMYKQFLEREELYRKNNYPFKIIKINL